MVVATLAIREGADVASVQLCEKKVAQMPWVTSSALQRHFRHIRRYRKLGLGCRSDLTDG